MSKIVERKEPFTLKEAYNFANEMNIGSKADYHCLMSMLTDVIVEHDKYRWHDLRKNPDDLPKIGSDIVYLFIYSGEHERRLHSNALPFMFEDDLKSNDEFEYIAWKYLEPFEGGGVDGLH